MLSALFTAGFGALLTGIGHLLIEWMKLGQARAAGAAEAVATVNAGAAVTQAAIAQAEAVAPPTRLAVVDRLNAGTF